MTADDVFKKLASLNVRVDLFGDKLRFVPTDKITPELKQQIIANRDEMLEVMREVQPLRTWIWNRIGNINYLDELARFKKRFETDYKQFSLVRPIAADTWQLIHARQKVLRDRQELGLKD